MIDLSQDDAHWTTIREAGRSISGIGMWTKINETSVVPPR
jgi:hypothetical protein